MPAAPRASATRATPTPGDDDTAALIELLATPGMGPKRLALLLAHFTTPCAALDAPRREWRHAGLPEAVIQARADAEKVAAITGWLAADDTHHLIARGDPHFPTALDDLPDAPAALFARGDIAALGEPQIAMVGSRTPTTGGRQNARAFARHLAKQGLVITSGLALGVDGEAHRGALDARGITIAVLGSGIDRIYPPEHTSLADEIVAGGGVILSEWLPGTEPRRGHFPRRNRLISGLASGVLVVEASVKSGSLITARLAGEQGRDVFAIPGSIHNPLARGCHYLIREGAKLVETGQDVLEELAPTLRRQLDAVARPAHDEPQPTSSAPAMPRDPDQQRVLDLLGHDPQPADTLIEASGLTAGEVSSILLMLELAGEVSTLPGGLYVRTNPA